MGNPGARINAIAYIHTRGIPFVAFLILHLYLVTTGHTVLSNLKAMITGVEEIDEETEEEEEKVGKGV